MSNDVASPERRPLDSRAVLITLALCVAWGTQQVAAKSVAASVAPTMQLAVRFLFAAACFGAWLLHTEGRRACSDGTLRSGLLLGVFFTLQFGLVGEALRYTSAAHVIVFMYSAPVFTALGLQLVPEERLTGLQWGGIALAFGGIMATFLGRADRAFGQELTGDLLALGAGIAWGFNNVVLRRSRVGSATAAKAVFYQVAMAAVALLAYCARTGQTHIDWTPAAIAVLAFQSVVIATGSYLVWYWLLRHYLTSRLMLLTLLTPLFGVAFGALTLGERIEMRFAVGATLVLGGILVVNARQLTARRAAPQRGGT